MDQAFHTFLKEGRLSPSSDVSGCRFEYKTPLVETFRIKIDQYIVSMIDTKQASQLLKLAVKLLDSKPPLSDLKWDELLGVEPFSKPNSRALEHILYLCYLKINGRAKTLKSEVGRLWAPLDQFDSSVIPPPRDKDFPREFRVAMKDWITNSLASQGLVDEDIVKTFTVAYQAACGPRALELLCSLVFLALQHDLNRSLILNTTTTEDHTTSKGAVETHHTIIAALDALQQLWKQSHAEEIMPCLTDKGADKASRLVALSSSSSSSSSEAPVLTELQSSVCCLDAIRCRLRMMRTINNTNTNSDDTQVLSSLAALKALSHQVSHDIQSLSSSSEQIKSNSNIAKLLDKHLSWLEDVSLLTSNSNSNITPYNPLRMTTGGVTTEYGDDNSISSKPTLTEMIHDAKRQIKCTVHKQVGDNMRRRCDSASTVEKQGVEEVQPALALSSSPLSLAVVQQHEEEEEEEEYQPSPHLHIHPSPLPDAAYDLSDGDLERLMSSSPLPTPTVRMTNQHWNDDDGLIAAVPSPLSPPPTEVLIEHHHQQQPDREIAAVAAAVTTTTPTCDGKMPGPKRLSMTPMLVVLSKLGGRNNVPDIDVDIISTNSPGGGNGKGRGGTRTSLVKEEEVEEEETTPVVISKQRRMATSGFATLMKKMQNLRRRKATDGDE